MNSFVRQPLDKKVNKQNIISRLKKAENRIFPSLKLSGIAEGVDTVEKLDQLTNDMGDQIAGRFIAASDVSPNYEPTSSDFSGAFLAGDAQTPADEAGAFNLGVVDAGVTKYGVGALGEYANGMDFIGSHKATPTSGNVRRLRRGFQELQGSDEASWILEYIDATAGTNLITSNPGFETGDATGWTLANNASIIADTRFGSSYALKIDGVASATSNKYACTAGNRLIASFSAEKDVSSSFSTYVYIRFYNATPTLLSTVLIAKLQLLESGNYSITTTVPAGATQFEVFVSNTGGGFNWYLDNFSVTTVSTSNQFGFLGTDGKLITNGEDGNSASSSFGNNKIAAWPIAPGVITGGIMGGSHLDAGAIYKYCFTFVDINGDESLQSPTTTYDLPGTDNFTTVTLPGLPPGAVAMNVYRSEGGSSVLYYCFQTAISGGVGDNTPDSSLDTSRTPPTYNSTTERPFYPPYAWIEASLGLSNKSTWDRTIDSLCPLNYRMSATVADAADGDWYTFPLFIAAGTYTMTVNGITNTTNGKIDWYLDGAITGITGQDWYSAAATRDVQKTGSITVAISGYHQLMALVNGKHASSTDYVFSISFIKLTPAAY